MAGLKFNLPSAPTRDRNKISLCPDVLNYQFDQDQYKTVWSGLNQSNRGYLLADQCNLYRVSGWQFAWEKFKGWFGFDNRCHPCKIVLTAKKLAYFGYLNGFQQEEMVKTVRSWDKIYQPNREYLEDCKLQRSPQNSHALQNFLCDDYRNNFFILANKQFPSGFVFGQTYAQYKDFAAMAQIDPQDIILISDHIESLKGEDTLPNSTCRHTFIYQSIDKIRQELSSGSSSVKLLIDRFYKILDLWPSKISDYIKDLMRLVKACDTPLEHQQEYERAYTKVAEFSDLTQFNAAMETYFMRDPCFLALLDREEIRAFGAKLLEHEDGINDFSDSDKDLYLLRIAQICVNNIPEKLFKKYVDHCLKMKDFDLAYRLIHNQFPRQASLAMKYLNTYFEQFKTKLTSPSPLQQAYSDFLVTEANSFSNRINFFSDRQRINFDRATSITPSLLKGKASGYYFKLYVNEGRWEEAWNLFKSCRDDNGTIDSFSIVHLQKLAAYFREKSKQLYLDGKNIKTLKPEEAESNYRTSLTMMENAAQIIRSDEHLFEVNIHRRCLAQIIIDRASQLPNPERLIRLREAISYLEQAESASYLKDDVLPEVYVQALEQQIELLHENCLQAEFGDFSIATAKHKQSCNLLVQELVKRLDKLISLLSNDANDSTAKNKLAAHHFLKADCLHYFELKGNPLHHVQQAKILNPTNPFYEFYFAGLKETSPEEWQSLSTRVSRFFGQYPLRVDDYRHWYEERWQPLSDRVFKVRFPVQPLENKGQSIFSQFSFHF